MVAGCAHCQAKDAEILALRAELEDARLAIRELDKLCTLQKADLERVGKERAALEPNHAERLPGDELQLVFDQLLETLGVSPVAANDAQAAGSEESPASSPATEGAKPGSGGSSSDRLKKKGHGRRPLDTANLPVQEVVVDPEAVTANPELYRLIGSDCSERVGYREASYVCIRLVRRKYVLAKDQEVSERASAPAHRDCDDAELHGDDVASASQRVLCAAVPGYFWPRVMADASAITQVILSKYDMCLPLHRQERASQRCGLHLPRSTQCDWLSAAHRYLYRIVDAMMDEACRTSFCIATDATGAPVRMPRECANWHLFVFLADDDHVIFRPSRRHDGASITKLLDGFRGYLLSDASLIYNVLHEKHAITEVCCWSHLRRYVWRCRATDPDIAMQGLAVIAQLFKANRDTISIPIPERTAERARRALPILDVFDRWVERARPRADERSPLDAALTYYDNQREGLRTFLTDGRLRLDNNLSEQQLRQLVLGLHNWNYFENESGLNWYAVFRSLIASCKLHDIEPKYYLDEVLRLAPHWPTTKTLELSPKYWGRTRAALSSEHRAVIVPPWMESRQRASRPMPRPAGVAA
jgi:hypothetical protein